MMKAAGLLRLLPVLVSLTACSGADVTPGEPLAYDALKCPAVAFSTGIDQPGVKVIDNAHEFTEVYAASDLNNQDDIPAVDFDRQVVIAIHLGTKPTSGYGLRLTSVKYEGDRALINYDTLVPGNGCMLNQVITYPYCLIAVDDRIRQVQVRERIITSSC